MQNHSTKLHTPIYLISSLLAVALIILISNQFGEEASKLVTNLVYIPIPGIVVVLSIIFAIRNGLKGNHGKAWVLFCMSAVSWFVGEQMWAVYDLVYAQDPFPSPADIFYLSGYFFFFGFSIYYLQPVKGAISKKMIVASTVISMPLLIPTFYYSLIQETEISMFELALGASYPIADAITLVPAIIGIALFFGGKVNFMWSLVMIGMLVFVVADTVFLSALIEDSYYTGHPIDILYLFSYLLFAFGIRDHMKIFKKRTDETRFFNQEDFR